MHNKHIRWIVSLILLSLLTAAVFGLNAVFQTRTAQAQEGPTSGDLLAPNAEWTCTINNVAVYDNRIHVRCSNANGAIFYYAAASTDANANRFLTLLNTAYALGKQPVVVFDPNSAHNPTGCLTADCRLLTGVVIKP